MSILFFRKKGNKKGKHKSLIELAEDRARQMGWDTRPLSDKPLTNAWRKRVGKIK